MSDFYEQIFYQDLAMIDAYAKIQQANEISNAINNLAASNARQHVTEWDKNLQAIADTGAKCRYRIYKGICKQEECINCETAKLYNECYNALAACDKLKVDNEEQSIVNTALAQEEQEKARNAMYAAMNKSDARFNFWLITISILLIVTPIVIGVICNG